MMGSRPVDGPLQLGTFRYRTGGAIAVSRLVLASVFLLAIYVDPSQPSAAPERVYILLASYILTAAIVTVVAWYSWWWDHRLASPMHVTDLLVFALVVFSTEGYTSPFFTFSLFLLLSAAMRWGWRETARSAIAVNVLFLVAGLASGLLEAIEIDGQRLLIRGTYLAVLSALCVWFTFDRDKLARKASLPTRLRGFNADTDVMEMICGHVSNRTAAKHIVCVLRDEGELQIQICQPDDLAGVQRSTVGKNFGELFDTLPDAPFLLDPASGRMLVGSAQSASPHVPDEYLKQFCEDLRLGSLLGIVVWNEGLECVVFIGGLPGITVDDLTRGTEIAEEIAFLYGQSVLRLLSQQAAANRARLSIARDLHDSVAQIVAGISFRLEGFKRSGKAAPDLAPDLDVLQEELAVEQQVLRSLIADLRRPVETREPVYVVGPLCDLANRLGRQWGIACTFAGSTGLRADKEIELELNQMIREGVANAVRHGAADRVSIALRETGSRMILEITDNGNGGPAAKPPLPRTLNERAEALGGMLETISGPEGAIVRIHFPAGAKS